MMLEVKRALDARGHAIIESPTGTGKTVALLSLITSYQFAHPKTGKLIYATRTVPEMTKCMEELKLVLKNREATLGATTIPFLAVCLSSRKNMCIHPEITANKNKDSVDAECRKKIASWIRQQYGRSSVVVVNPPPSTTTPSKSNHHHHLNEDERDYQLQLAQDQAEDPDYVAMEMERNDHNNNNQPSTTTTTTTSSTQINHPSTSYPPALCSYYETLQDSSHEIPTEGIFTLDDMKELGMKLGMCPYFLTRRLIESANVVVYNFSYLLDPKVANIVSKKIDAESIVVFDESHNVDNVCIEALSVNFNSSSITRATGNVSSLKTKINTMKQTDKERLQREYEQLVQGLNANNNNNNTDTTELASPIAALPDDILNEAIPGTIRQADHFINMMSNIVAYMKKRMDAPEAQTETPNKFLHDLESTTGIQSKPLRFAHARLDSLMRTLRVVDLEEYNPIARVCDFLTLVATPAYAKGFVILIEPHDPRFQNFKDPVLQYACLDASYAIKPVFDRFKSVLITSGTLSPIDFYPKLLAFQPVVSKQLSMSITRNCILPLIVTRGSDQSPVTSEYALRDDPSTVKNYGALLLEVVKTVPDGVVCFFTAYDSMERIVTEWESQGVLNQVLDHKLIFIETKDIVETSLALDNFRRACDCGRGAVFLSVARGKVSEGIDFEKHYGRAVILFGVPFQYAKSKVLLERLYYLRDKFQIKEGEVLQFDALRSASQCLGRVLRSKQDWGIMILADRRFASTSNRSKLPTWISQFLKDTNTNLSVDECVSVIRTYLREISQPFGGTTTTTQQQFINNSNGPVQLMGIEKLESEALVTRALEYKKNEIESEKKRIREERKGDWD
jgi:DNA excision repair protein ERCC-2